MNWTICMIVLWELLLILYFSKLEITLCFDACNQFLNIMPNNHKRYMIVEGKKNVRKTFHFLYCWAWILTNGSEASWHASLLSLPSFFYGKRWSWYGILFRSEGIFISLPQNIQTKQLFQQKMVSCLATNGFERGNVVVMMHVPNKQIKHSSTPIVKKFTKWN